jgi:CDP-diacylglycerol--glycerol-3-phosphate 3-phosphatidyltransferase
MPPGATPPSTALWTLPNVVSMSRVLLAAGFLATSGNGERIALVGVASLTDFLDGWLARRRNAVSRWGALIDPLADRTFVLAAVTALLAQGQLSALQYVVLLFRDLMTAVGFVVARLVSWLRPVAFRARPLGKVVTALQLAALLAVLVWPAVIHALVLVVGVLSVAATVDYTLVLWRERDRTLKP